MYEMFQFQLNNEYLKGITFDKSQVLYNISLMTVRLVIFVTSKIRLELSFFYDIQNIVSKHKI